MGGLDRTGLDRNPHEPGPNQPSLNEFGLVKRTKELLVQFGLPLDQIDL